ncbi:MAG TPA: hypothetical protein VF816_00030 [Rhodocyclaceae bacterium]
MDSTDPSASRAGIPPLLIAGGILAFLVVLVMVVALGMVLALREDVGRLEEQARRSAKTAKALQEELASLKEQAAALDAKRRAPAAPAATSIDAVDTANDCVIRPGSSNPMAGCLQLDRK